MVAANIFADVVVGNEASGSCGGEEEVEETCSSVEVEVGVGSVPVVDVDGVSCSEEVKEASFVVDGVVVIVDAVVMCVEISHEDSGVVFVGEVGEGVHVEAVSW